LKIVVPLVFWKRAFRDDRGVTAVEFALIAVPFLALMFAILETALIYIAGGMLQTAVTESSRGIMTGEFRQSDEAKFKQAICNRLVVMFQCSEKLAVDVRSLKSLQGAGRSEPFVKGVYDTSGWGYAPGGAGGVMVVTAAYPWRSFTNFMDFKSAQGPAAPHVLIAASAFKNEQY
jgi:Flp pilus assembly protein TadG